MEPSVSSDGGKTVSKRMLRRKGRGGTLFVALAVQGCLLAVTLFVIVLDTPEKEAPAFEGQISMQEPRESLEQKKSLKRFTQRMSKPRLMERLAVEGALASEVPPLPELFDLTHDQEDLRHHAFILASEEFESGVIGENLVEGRVTYLVWAWTPLLQDRQARYQAALAERAARQDYQVADARREAEWEADLKEHRRETERLMMIERHTTIPVLTPEERAELESISGD